MRPLFQKAEKAFNIFVAVCILIALGIFILELTVKIETHTMHILHTMDSWLMGIFIFDLGLSFTRAYDKRKFIKKNWLLAISFFPLVRTLSLINARRFLEFIRLYKHRHGLDALEGVGVKGIKEKRTSLEKAIAGLGSTLKPGKLDWGAVHGKKALVNLFISPNTDDLVVAGIKRGIKDFLKEKVEKRVTFTNHSWLPIHKIEQKEMLTWNIDANRYLSEISDKIDKGGINIIITDSEVVFNDTMTEMSAYIRKNKNSSYFLFSTKGLDDFSASFPVEIWKQKELRGYIVGYNTLVKRYEYNFLKRKCTEQFCIHKDIHRSDLDLHSFMYFINRRTPICDVHAI